MNLSLQRKLQGDGCHWRTVHRFTDDEAGPVLDAAQIMGRVGQPIEFRVIVDALCAGPLLMWTRDAGWQTCG